MRRPRPPRWPRPGSPLAVAAPSGAFDPAEFTAGLEALAKLAPASPLRVDEAVRARDGYLAGDDPARAAHLAELMGDASVGGVICARGGFGASRLLPRLDMEGLAAGGVCLIGFSDITALLNPLAMAGLMTVHGPVVTQLPRLDDPSRAALAELLAGRPPWPGELSGQGLTAGRAHGRLLGGNLTLLGHLLGTPYFPEVTDAVLFIEEVNEEPYRLDRLLTQLELAGVLDAAAGLAVGGLGDDGPGAPALAEVVRRRLGGLDRPVVMGLPFGHGQSNRPLLVGATAEIDASAGTLVVGADLD